MKADARQVRQNLLTLHRRPLRKAIASAGMIRSQSRQSSIIRLKSSGESWQVLANEAAKAAVNCTHRFRINFLNFGSIFISAQLLLR